MAAGTIPISMTQQLDVYAQPLAGGQLYIIQAGTVSTPQDAFQDVALTIKQPYPMSLDAAGRVPQFFLDNTINATVKIRLQDKNGVVQLAADNVLIIGPAGGTGGGGTPVDPSTVYQTGDIKLRYDIGVHPGASPGWVRANGLTIGSSTSGATMPENGTHGETQALFLHLYNKDLTLTVSGGRTGNALNDWTANKNIATPDFRGIVPGGLDGMGNTLASRLTSAYFGTDATILGAFGGTQSQLIAQNQLPNISPTFAGTSVVIPTETFSAITGTIAPPLACQTGLGTGAATGSGFATSTFTLHVTSVPAGTISSINGGVGPSGLVTVQPTKLCTIYLKL